MAEIEVLARKETFIFCIYLFYLFLPKNIYRFYYKLLALPLAVLIWEPVFFFFLFFFAVDLIHLRLRKLDIEFVKSISSFIPATILVFYLALNPLSPENHSTMTNYLMINFNEICYMSCELLSNKSSIYQQFSGNYNGYSFSVFFRYTLIILISFGPLILLAFNSTLKNSRIIFFEKFNNLLGPILLCLAPVIFLFAMGYDWGRWVNISYVFSILFYIYLYKSNQITLNKKKLTTNHLYF